MRRASSASAVWRAPRSASEYTATVRMPMARAAAITRQAISPRLAMRILRNTLFLRPLRLHLHGFEFLHPGGLALLQERGDAFLALGRDTYLGDAFRGVGNHRVVHRAGAHLAHQVLDLAVRRLAADHQVAEDPVDRAIQLLGRADV